jgi:hypothetical protein
MTKRAALSIAMALAVTLGPFAAFAQTTPVPAAPAKPAQAGNPYPTAVIDAFIGSCGRESGGRTEFCRCLIDGLQKKMSFNEFKRWETAGALGMQVAQAVNEKVLDVSVQCRWPD